MTTQTILPMEASVLAAISEQSGEPAWLKERRLHALELAGGLELPKLEKTKIERWSLQNYGTPGKANTDGELPDGVSALLDPSQNSNLVVQRNSGAVLTRLADDLAAQGVIFTDLETAAKEHGELVQKYLSSVIPAEENQLTALHHAVWNGGVFLYVPRNVEIEIPLQAAFLVDDAGSLFAPHVLVIAESNSRVTYVDNYISANELGGELVHNGAVEVIVKDGAKVQFATVHNLGSQITDMTYRRAVVENDGSIEWIIGEMNNGDAMSETLSVLKGNGSLSDTKIIAVGSGSQRLNLTTKATHFGKSSESQMITRAVMREEATAIINGITKIEKGSTKANGEQTEKVLMLSPKARGDANPILLIDEDDVKAGHAASVGQVNPEQIYYLMSRGISREQAERLIIYGFLAPVVSEIPLEQLQNQLQALVERKLGQ